MATWITIANGRYNEEYETLYCENTTRTYKDKNYKTPVYDADSKTRSEMELEIVLRDKNSGEEVPIEKFQVVTNQNRSADWHPTHHVRVKVGG